MQLLAHLLRLIIFNNILNYFLFLTYLLILKLNTRSLNCLRAANIETIGELLSIDRFELRKFRNIGKKGIDDINRKLKDFGIETPDFRIW